MEKGLRKFPLIADGEAAISSPRLMQLYENEDLISNIKGTYLDKTYDDDATILKQQHKREEKPVSKEDVKPLNVNDSPKSKLSYAEKARQEAREDLRRKRQAILSVEKKTSPTKLSDKVPPAKKAEPARALSKYSEKLRQETYILADIKPTYREPVKSKGEKPKKNNYDFLKTSQIYNKEVNQTKKERRVAQELNLTRFDDLN